MWLRLKLLADAGLVGPAQCREIDVSSTPSPMRRPRSALIPSPPCVPQLGVVSRYNREFVVADIPGLIEGAADGAGIGDRFLGHIERCKVLLHLVDATEEDPVGNYRIVRGELDAYGEGLVDKPQVIGLNKIDALEPDAVKKLVAKLKRASKSEVLPMSGAGGAGIDAVVERLIEAIGPAEGAPARDDDTPPGQWSPV